MIVKKFFMHDLTQSYTHVGFEGAQKEMKRLKNA